MKDCRQNLKDRLFETFDPSNLSKFRNIQLEESVLNIIDLIEVCRYALLSEPKDDLCTKVSHVLHFQILPLLEDIRKKLNQEN